METRCCGALRAQEGNDGHQPVRSKNHVDVHFSHYWIESNKQKILEI